MLETFTLQTFEPLVGASFAMTVVAPDGAETAVELVLAAATAAPAPPGDRGRPPFSLEFRGPAEPVFPQATYPLQQERLGAFELFLVPIGRDADGVRYEAVFS